MLKIPITKTMSVNEGQKRVLTLMTMQTHKRHSNLTF